MVQKGAILGLGYFAVTNILGHCTREQTIILAVKRFISPTSLRVAFNDSLG